MDVRAELSRKLSAKELMLSNCSVGEDSWESLGLQGDPTSPSWRKSVLNIHWKDWGWNWNSNILATWCEELTHLKRPWFWEWLKAGGEGDDRGWDGWMASLTQWTRVRVNSGSWWWTEKPGVLRSMGSQKVGHDWETELNWTEHIKENLAFLCALSSGTEDIHAAGQPSPSSFSRALPLPKLQLWAVKHQFPTPSPSPGT